MESIKDEIGKGNQIIQKLQSKGQELHNKYKAKSEKYNLLEAKVQERQS